MKKTNRPFTTAVILAAGSGSRMNLNTTKQQLTILGKTVLRRAVEVFEESHFVDEIILVCRAGEEDFAKSEVVGLNKVKRIVPGGKTRAESSKIGFDCIADKGEGFVMIHDAARCLVTEDDIALIMRMAYEHKCASASNYVSDTVKKVDFNNFVLDTLPRGELRTVQTPQAFFCPVLKQAFEASNYPYEQITDDNMLVELIGEKIVAVPTSKSNIKITTVDDIEYAEFVISKRQNSENT